MQYAPNLNQRARLAMLLVVLAGTVLGAGQAPTPPAPAAPQTPTFKVAVDYVEVDAVVTDRNGQFVRDLKQDDFQVFEDGKPQTISTFSMIDIPVERLQRPLYASEPIEADVKSNEHPFDGRVYVMIIDDLHTYPGRVLRVRAAARQFIQQHLGSNDLMAIVHTAGASDASQDFTSSKRLLLAAIDRTNGRKLDSAALLKTDDFFGTTPFRQNDSSDPKGDVLDAERSFNARRSLGTLKDVAEWFSTVRGRRKTILFLSEGIDYDISDFNNNGTSAVIDSTREVLSAAAKGNVSIYGIDPRGLTNLLDQSIEIGSLPDDPTVNAGDRALQNELFLSQNSLRELSEATGGFAVVNSNDFANAFDRVVRDNSTYYVMAYYPPTDKAGKFHKIDVRVSRPGLQVRARQGYVTPKPVGPVAEKPGAKKGAPANNLMTPEIRAALNSPLPISGLSMTVFAAPFKGTAPNASVLFGVELRGRDMRLNSSDKVALSYVAVDPDGKVRNSRTDAVAMTLKPETKARVSETGLRMLNRMDLPPGRYQIHFAAHDEGGGNVGTVLYDLDVPDFQKLPFSMSGLVLTSASSLAQPTARGDDNLKQVLPGPPVASRTFPQGDELALFVEVYDNEADKPHKVDITTTVTTDEGKVITKTDEVRDSSELQGHHGGYGFATRLPIKDMAPGSYVLAVSAKSRLGGTPAATRQVQFTVTAARAVPSR